MNSVITKLRADWMERNDLCKQEKTKLSVCLKRVVGEGEKNSIKAWECVNALYLWISFDQHLATSTITAQEVILQKGSVTCTKLATMSVQSCQSHLAA